MKQTRWLLLVCVVFAGWVKAQDSTGAMQDGQRTPRSWFRLGIGATSTYTLLGGGVFFRVGDPLSIGIRGGVALEHQLLSQPAEALWEITPALAYSPVAGSKGMISVVLGAGIVGGTMRGEFLRRQVILVEEYEKVKFQEICGVAELQGTFFVTKGLGLNVTVFANANRVRKFSGYHVGLQFTQP